MMNSDIKYNFFSYAFLKKFLLKYLERTGNPACDIQCLDLFEVLLFYCRILTEDTSPHPTYQTANFDLL